MAGTTPAIIELVQTLGNQSLPTDEAVKQLDPSQHDVFNRQKRKKRKVVHPTGRTEIVELSDGRKVEKDVVEVKYEEVNRIAVPLQELIVNRRAAFINSGNMNVIAKPGGDIEQRLFDMVKKCMTDNKVEYKLTEIAKRQMSELQCAMIWYSEDVEKGYWGDLSAIGTFRMRMKIVSPLLGDKLLPVFDGSGRLVYFARGYKQTPDLTKNINVNNPEAIEAVPLDRTETEHLDIYSDQCMLQFHMERGVWVFDGRVDYTYGSLPVIYFSQDKAEWANVQPIIERIETLISNFADTNDANGSPILFAKGIIQSMPSRGETGKVINLKPTFDKDGKEIGSPDLKYVTWDRAPDSIKLELETHLNNVYTLTQTPDISTTGMSKLSIDSGVAFDRVFLDAHLGAMKHTNGSFGECVQRMINFLKKACVAIDKGLKPASSMEITPEFPLFRINDHAQTIDMLIAATGGEPLLSRETAVGMTGLVQDAEAENKLIDKQRDTLGKEIDSEFEGGEEKE